MKIRILSDLHLDINKQDPLVYENKDIFTVICGDTSGYPDMTIKWIKENCPNGVGVSGNHLPYNNYNKTIQELRNELATAFPITNSFTYLDCETNVFCKEVDNILFIGTCMYTNMAIKHAIWNPEGDIELNKRCSKYNMNDYYWGIKDNTLDPPSKISPNDYCDWFKNAYQKIENILNENEHSVNPKDVILITHHPLITDFFGHNGYVEDDHYSQKYFNNASYASDMKKWLIRHTSIKCYCCGHIHAVDPQYRILSIPRENNHSLLVVNNARGYVKYGHNRFFDRNLLLDTNTWKIEYRYTPKD